VEYYSSWAQKDPAAAPQYRAISGMGDVNAITSRVFEALTK
jgi:adenylate kinase